MNATACFKFFLLLLFLIPSGCSTAANLHADRYELLVPPMKSETPENEKPHTEWRSLLKESQIAMIGIVKESKWISDPEKVKGVLNYSGNDLADISPGKFVLGVLVSVKIEEVIYAKKGYKANESIDVYVKDGYFPPTDTDIPTFINGGRYLIFLSRVEKEDSVDNVRVFDPSALQKDSVRFDHRAVFRVSRNSAGRFQLTDSNAHIVEEVRQAVLARKK